MNRLSTAGFVPPLFVLAKGRSGQLSTIPWGLEGRLVSWPPDTSASCCARPRRAPPPHRAPRRPGPPVVCSGFPEGFTATNRRRYTGQQPGTKGASRPCDKPVINRGFCSSIGLHGDFACSCFQRHTQEVILPPSGGYESLFSPVLPVLARPRRFAVRRPVPTRPGYVRVLDSTGE